MSNSANQYNQYGENSYCEENSANHYYQYVDNSKQTYDNG